MAAGFGRATLPMDTEGLTRDRGSAMYMRIGIHMNLHTALTRMGAWYATDAIIRYAFALIIYFWAHRPKILAT
jgi:hypothetical protein